MNDRDKIRKQFQENVKAVSDLMRENRPDFRERMEDLGYEWVDDGTDEVERQEEEGACPQSDGEKRLVDYFESEMEPDDPILQLLFDEYQRDDTNFPLFRKYFKKGNLRLKNLILYGLRKKPNDHSLLMALSYFNEFHPDVQELCDCFIKACVAENELKAFEEIARSFWTHTESFHYEALPELCGLFAEESAKGKIVRQLVVERDRVAEPRFVSFGGKNNDD